MGKNKEDEKEVVAAMFVPPSLDSKLMKSIEEEERKMSSEMDWGIKLVEQSGLPLGLMFVPKFPLQAGCPKGNKCIICSNTGVKCGKKGVIYKASCAWCKRENTDLTLTSSTLMLQAPNANEQTATGAGSVEVVTSSELEVKILVTDGEGKIPVADGEILLDNGDDKVNIAMPLVDECNIATTPVNLKQMAEDITTETTKFNQPVRMNGMNNQDLEGGVGESSSTRPDSDYVLNCDISYIGETARPFRERVFEHQKNLENCSPKSFIIAHWMEAHASSLVAPEFEWNILDSYGDALRRQLGEGLHILHSGVLNRKQEYNNNIICRMQVTRGKEDLSERDLQKELEKKKIYNNRLKSFIKKLSQNNVIIKNENNASLHDDTNEMLCYRPNQSHQLVLSPVRKRKRSAMETSTPIHVRRETQMIDLGEDSPLDSDISSLYSPSDDKVPDTKQKAGMSNEMNSVVMTPPQLVSPDTMDRKLALHARDLVTASTNNPGLLEMQELAIHTVNMTENPFAKRDDGRQGGDLADPIGDEAESMEDKNIASVGVLQAVGMNGMNNASNPMPEEANIIQSVAMDGMNNPPIGGGRELETGAGMEGYEERRIVHGLRRFIHPSGDRKNLLSGQDCKVALGLGARRELLEARACPEGFSPKRPTPMEVDARTPSKKKRKARAKKLVEDKTDSSQRLMTDLWKKEERKNKLDDEGN